MPVPLRYDGGVVERTQVKKELGSDCDTVVFPPALKLKPLTIPATSLAPLARKVEPMAPGAVEPGLSGVPRLRRGTVANRSRPLVAPFPPTPLMLTPPLKLV